MPARRGEVMNKLAVVRQQQQAGGVGIQPAPGCTPRSTYGAGSRRSTGGWCCAASIHSRWVCSAADTPCWPFARAVHPPRRARSALTGVFRVQAWASGQRHAAGLNQRPAGFAAAKALAVQQSFQFHGRQHSADWPRVPSGCAGRRRSGLRQRQGGQPVGQRRQASGRGPPASVLIWPAAGNTVSAPPHWARASARRRRSGVVVAGDDPGWQTAAARGSGAKSRPRRAGRRRVRCRLGPPARRRPPAQRCPALRRPVGGGAAQAVRHQQYRSIRRAHGGVRVATQSAAGRQPVGLLHPLPGRMGVLPAALPVFGARVLPAGDDQHVVALKNRGS